MKLKRTPPKQRLTVFFSPGTIDRLNRLGERWGMDPRDVLEIVVQRVAEQEGLTEKSV